MSKPRIIPAFDDLDFVHSWTLNSQFETVYANESAKKISEDPFIGLVEEDRKKLQSFIRAALKEDGIYLPWISPDSQSVLWFKWRVKKQDDHFFLFATNVTDVKKHEYYFEQILDSIADLILVKGENSKIVWANKAFQNYYRLSNDQLKEMIDAPFVSPDFTNQYIIDDREVWDSGKPLLIECEPVVRFDGLVRKFQTLKTPIFGPHNKVLFTVGISRDITEKIENQEKSMTASKMAAIGEMAGGMAHEINNPIAVISGKSYVLRRLFNKGAEITKESIFDYLDTIDRHVERVANVISCLRRLSTSDDFEQFSHVDIKNLINDTLILCEAKIKEKGIVINLEVPTGLLVDARAVQLSQALLNLINNAADAAEVSKNKWIKIEAKTTKDKIKILISDSGAGVPDEILGKIFQPFFTTKEIGKGSGLGLSFSLSVAKNHSGTLRVAKEISHSCFELEFPIHRVAQT